ncbi:MAG TPA: helix-turn-helix domain-containing protein [Candidatus Sulfotelmatobacter sp.]|nr:helix-turn-helix domain-containing protein [Candidatus Sulfotelmatobacter sp.]
MSQERVLKTLESLGFALPYARVYVLLSKRGPQKAKDIAKCLNMRKQSVYFIISNLQKQGIITSTIERPARFSAVPFEKVLDLFVKTKMEEAKQLQRNKKEIISDWQSIDMREINESFSRFTVIQGRNTVNAKIKQMINQSKTSLSTVTTITNLTRAELAGLFDSVLEHSNRRSIHLRFLTELPEKNTEIVKSLLRRILKQGFNLYIRIPDLGLRLPNRMIIRDEEEAIFFVTAGTESTAEQDDLCLWTDCQELVHSFIAVFEDLWRNSTDIQKKIIELETGISPKTIVLRDADGAHNKYQETVDSAKRSIFVMTSSTGLVKCWQDQNQMDAWIRKGISVRIMAPIISENLDIAHKLKKTFQVRHVPTRYMGITIIDGQHLFQSKTPLPGEETQSISHFENTIYTNDSEYVEKAENTLEDIWKHAQIPSFVALKEINQQSILLNKPTNFNALDEYANECEKVVGFSYRMEPQLGAITEKEVLNKIASAKRIPAKNPATDTIRIYGTMGTAIIYPPKNLNLPNFIIQVTHYNRNSSFGAGNSLWFYIETKIADQKSYLQAAFATDNLQGYKFRKAMHEDQQTTEHIQFLKKDELKVEANNDRLFAGWTVPIPLLPPKYILPPACIIFEGFGKIKSYTSEVKGPLNRRVKYECNGLDSFVTFMHPSKNYYGTGSDGLLRREVIMTSYPPSA